MGVSDIGDILDRIDGVEARLGARIDEVGARIDTAEARMREHAEPLAAETRRHFDVVAEGMMSKVQLLTEGILAVDQKLDRFRNGARAEFRRVDQRFLHVEARLTTLESRML